MFIDDQNFAGSCERNFFGNWFVALKGKTIHYFVKLRGDVNSWVTVTLEINEHSNPTNNDDSTVHILTKVHLYIQTKICVPFFQSSVFRF